MTSKTPPRVQSLESVPQWSIPISQQVQPFLLPADVGYPAPTPIGDEPAVVTTAPVYPKNFCGQGLLIVQPTSLATTLDRYLRRSC